MSQELQNNEIVQMLRGGRASTGTAFTETIKLKPIEEDHKPVDLSNGPSEQLMERRTSSGLQGLITNDANLARDLALFGTTHLPEILHAYDMTIEDLLERQESTAFKTLLLQFKNDFAKDRHGGTRARASSYLDVLMERVFTKSMAEDCSAQQVLKSAQFMAGLADAMPKGTNVDGTIMGGSSVSVNFYTGAENPLIKDVSSIDTREG